MSKNTVNRRPYFGLNKHIDFKKEKSKTNARKVSTEVFCCLCKIKFILPFRPRKRAIYCDDCFKKKNERIKKINKE